MKIHPKCKVELVASDEDTRKVITQPYLDMSVEGKPVVVATNGKSMAIIPVEVGPEDVAGWITEDALKAMRKSKVDEIKCNGDLKVTDGPTFPRPNLGQYPNWRMVVPAEDRKVGFRISLNARLLYELTQAIGTDCVELVFGEDDLEVILVKPTGSKENPAANIEAKGILMPMRTT
jgi:hypothetical protein